MSVKLRFDKHSHHMRMIDEFYELNKYIITEELKDALIDAKECIKYVIELNVKNDKKEASTINSSKRKTNFDVIKEMTLDELATFFTANEYGTIMEDDWNHNLSIHKTWLTDKVDENDS